MLTAMILWTREASLECADRVWIVYTVREAFTNKLTGATSRSDALKTRTVRQRIITNNATEAHGHNLTATVSGRADFAASMVICLMLQALTNRCYRNVWSTANAGRPIATVYAMQGKDHST